MKPVKAPQGHEGIVWYDDATRRWKVSFRSVGDTWWTNCHLDAGHTYTHENEVVDRAEKAIVHAMKIRGLLTE